MISYFNYYFNKPDRIETCKCVLLIDSMNKENRKTEGNPIQVHRNVNSKGKKAPLHRKSINVVGPETEKKDVIQEEFRQYVFNPQFSTPTSLPLSFFFGYQILHEMNELGLRGHVSFIINNVYVCKGIPFCFSSVSYFLGFFFQKLLHWFS